jgi:hypothetical protein
MQTGQFGGSDVHVNEDICATEERSKHSTNLNLQLRRHRPLSWTITSSQLIPENRAIASFLLDKLTKAVSWVVTLCAKATPKGAFTAVGSSS